MPRSADESWVEPAPRADVDGAEVPARLITYLPAAGVALSAFLLFGMMVGWPGHVVLLVSLAAAYAVDRELFKDLLLIGVGITIVSTTSVEADISWPMFIRLGVVLGGAVLVPVAIDRLIYRRRAIGFPWLTGKRWTRMQWGYVVAVPLLGWLVLPFYFIRSGAYQNWPPIQTASEFGRFFVGVNSVGLWDELFFMCICFALLRRHFSLWPANLLQATIFVSFLWELGYREWGPLLTIPFALLQGYIFTRTKSLTYVVIIHLLFDAIVFFAIVHAHDRSIFPYFVY
ncbi:MAG TPA: type II CAAX endopeptidase family protein [Ornithinimicrobium sp.]|uniref:type II CAAX endopeptidase family protein n=1 Tax=Ornithinimicrobium sp. TaxID=1977084 RepID=UPI002B483566|nr:type II CAAX endopeptidase family protein [Ornithinimicrobium sp.]HKJ11044.1 type II CAAX endopeptidase family protein [Ornithinimicrobium sp.]